MFQIDQTKASKKNAEKDAPAKCAACGKYTHQILDEKQESTSTNRLLKRCTACYSVRYCGVACQKSHRKSHKKDCKETAKKRRDFNAALSEIKLGDEVSPPPPPLDCDLCMYRMPPSTKGSKYFGCCGKIVCRACFVRSMPGDPFSKFKDFFGDGGAPEFFSKQFGASFVNDDFLSPYLGTFGGADGPFSAKKREQSGCPFCRSTVDIMVHTKEQQRKREECLLSRANNNLDSRAFLELARTSLEGRSLSAYEKLGCDDDDMLLMKGQPIPDPVTAARYFGKSADLGNADAYYELSKLHRECYDASGFLFFLVKAANLGNFDARDELASLAMEKKQTEVAMEHYKLLAAAGFSKDSTDMLTVGYKEGYITKEELASSLRAYQSARKELMSEERVQLDRMASNVSSNGERLSSGMYL